MSQLPQIKLSDNNIIPQLGFGVFQIEPKNTVEAVTQALETGYRHIDTAQMYGNEHEVGQAVAKSNLNRSHIFITSKLNNGFHEPDKARSAFAETLQKIGSDYIDLFLIHWPLPDLYDGDFLSTWKVLEEFKKDGRAKSIGVSNFQVSHLQKLIAESDVTPAVNQIELQPYFQNQQVAEFCRHHDIAVEAWSPIAQGDVLQDKVILEIAEDADKTSAQVVLRWHVQKGNIIFPKSVTPRRIAENFAIFDFELSDQQIEKIDQLDRGEAGRHGPNPDTFNKIPS